MITERKIKERAWPFLRLLERVADHPAMKGLREGMKTSIPFAVAGGAIVLLLSSKPFSERLLQGYWGALGFLCFALAYFIPAKYLAFCQFQRSLAGTFSLLLFISTLPFFPTRAEEFLFLFSLLSKGSLLIAVFLGLVQGGGEVLLRSKISALRNSVIRSGGLVFLLLLILLFVFQSLAIPLHSAIQILLSPLLVASESFPATLLTILLMNTLWLLGIQGTAIIGPIVAPIYLTLLQRNAEAVLNGTPPPHIPSSPFFYLVFIGGAGCTLPIAILLNLSRVRRLRNLGRMTILPALINVNEPLIYGLPVALNPYFAIPFFFSPLFLASINYFAMARGYVGKLFILVPFTMPTPVVAYLVSGGDWRNALLSLAECLLVFLFYLPFFYLYQRKALEEEQS